MTRCKAFFIPWSVSLLCAASIALTDVNSDMDNFFNRLGFDSNTGQPQVW